MAPIPLLRSSLPLVAVLALSVSVAVAQIPAPVPAPAIVPAVVAPATPPSPVSGIRNKISADDLLSAESILEVYRAKNGDDGPALVGLSWLARGALLLGEPVKAQRYATEVRAWVAKRMAIAGGLAKDDDAEYALGSVIEVEAQLIERKSGAARAAGFVRQELARWTGSVGLNMRLNKRLDMLTMPGTKAPEITVEDFLGTSATSLAALRGKPVLIFIWSATCGDCKAQAAALANVTARHAAAGLEVIALTRYAEDGAAARLQEKARVDSVWKAVYPNVGGAQVVFSDDAMVRYGGSSTPTLVFIDRLGVVRRYSPTRMTEAELDRNIAAMLR